MSGHDDYHTPRDHVEAAYVIWLRDRSRSGHPTSGDVL